MIDVRTSFYRLSKENIFALSEQRSRVTVFIQYLYVKFDPNNISEMVKLSKLGQSIII